MWIDDMVLADCEQDLALKLWVPESPTIVLGRSNKASVEVNLEACAEAAVPVLKRLGGGGTVVLHADCLIVSCGLWVQDYYKNDLYFRQLNQAIIDVFQTQLPDCDFTQRGYSDIVLGDRKLVGTSLFRSRNYLLYQASILIDPRVDLMEQLLQHPSLEPDYRKGRRHADFVMGLAHLSEHSAKDWRQIFDRDFAAALRLRLTGEQIEAQIAQTTHVKSRIGEERDLG